MNVEKLEQRKPIEGRVGNDPETEPSGPSSDYRKHESQHHKAHELEWLKMRKAEQQR